MKLEENSKTQAGDEKTGKDKKNADEKLVAVEELSEEDKALQEELELYVHRLEESDASLYIPALEALRTQIKSSTTSMTSVPKPLKFLRPHYETLKSFYDKLPTPETKYLLADIISILAMTINTDSHKTNGEALKYRLIGSAFESIGSWGHEYVRHISGEIASEFQSTTEPSGEYKDSLMKLVEEIIPYNMRHNAEAESCDLLIEIEHLDLLEKYIDNEDLCQKVCLYLRSVVPFLPDPDNTNLLRTILKIFLKFNKLTEAARVAMQLQDTKTVQEIFNKANDDQTIQKQIAFMIGRQQTMLDIEDQNLLEIASNSQLNTDFLTLARELDIMEPKTPDDIYKTHLETQSRLYSSSMNVDSARSNLASSFVNGFVNSGFGKEKMFSATASLGLILLIIFSMIVSSTAINSSILNASSPNFTKNESLSMNYDNYDNNNANNSSSFSFNWVYVTLSIMAFCIVGVFGAVTYKLYYKPDDIKIKKPKFLVVPIEIIVPNFEKSLLKWFKSHVNYVLSHIDSDPDLISFKEDTLFVEDPQNAYSNKRKKKTITELVEGKLNSEIYSSAMSEVYYFLLNKKKFEFSISKRIRRLIISFNEDKISILISSKFISQNVIAHCFNVNKQLEFVKFVGYIQSDNDCDELIQNNCDKHSRSTYFVFEDFSLYANTSKFQRILLGSHPNYMSLEKFTDISFDTEGNLPKHLFRHK